MAIPTGKQYLQMGKPRPSQATAFHVSASDKDGVQWAECLHGGWTLKINPDGTGETDGYPNLKFGPVQPITRDSFLADGGIE